jgi:hypothetical protein
MRYIHCAISVPRKRSALCIAIGRTVGIRESRKHRNANDKTEYILEQHSSGTELPDRHTAPTGFWMLIALSKCHSTKASSQHLVMVACLQPNTMTPFHPGFDCRKKQERDGFPGISFVKFGIQYYCSVFRTRGRLGI